MLLVGIDVIGDCLTEINVTSPTCMVEIPEQTGFDVAGACHHRWNRHAAPDRRAGPLFFCCWPPAAKAPAAAPAARPTSSAPASKSRCGANPETAPQALAAVLREFDRLHRMLSRLAALRTDRAQRAIADGERDIAVSPELAFVLQGAGGHRRAGDQLFNPALGRLIALWGFHADEFKPQLPRLRRRSRPW
jgi:hypothetical protein